MRVKLHLTEEELMNKSWIILNLEMRDYPYYDPKAKRIVRPEDTDKMLLKLLG